MESPHKTWQPNMCDVCVGVVQLIVSDYQNNSCAAFCFARIHSGVAFSQFFFLRS